MINTIVALTKYDNLGASSRLRTIQYFPYFKKNNFKVKHFPLLTNRQLNDKYNKNGYSIFSTIYSYLNRIKIILSSKDNELLIIEKEAFPWLPYFFEKVFLSRKKYILDYDDAIFHNYDSHKSIIIRYLLGNKLKKLMQNSCLNICGNKYLHNYAVSAKSKASLMIPTVVDLINYPLKKHNINKEKPIIVWIGSPSTIHYLSDISEVFKKLAKKYEFTLKIIGETNFKIKSIDIINIEWSEDNEYMELSSSDIGIMPLRDTKWELGKCGYKIIQYMACNLPVVASKIGANIDIVENNIDGILVKNHDEWFKALSMLLSDQSKRQEYGNNGRLKIEDKYNLEFSSSIYTEAIKEIS